MRTVQLGPITIPLLPYESAFVDWLIDGRLEDARPSASVPRVAPRWIQLIHSADDANATTTLTDAQALLAAGGATADLWIPPSGGHAGALRAHPDDYRNQIRAFLSVALR
jgi:hypothetical protein